MHRASAAENPTAPLGHHTFDSSHIAFGVATAAFDHGPWIAEGSIFNGREPDEHRWDFDFGRLDSFAGRLWYRPTPAWELQVSAGHLKDPEQLEPGTITRSTASLSWTRINGMDFSAMSAGYGHNDTNHGARSAVFVEGTRHVGSNSLYGRFEAIQTETALLLPDRNQGASSTGLSDPLLAFTVGAVRDVLRVSRLEGGFGADVTWYGAPDSLRAAYGNHPFGARIFFRVRPPSMERMMNMRMSQPMQGHSDAPMNHPMP
jgi:hypothetical protein